MCKCVSHANALQVCFNDQSWIIKLCKKIKNNKIFRGEYFSHLWVKIVSNKKKTEVDVQKKKKKILF